MPTGAHPARRAPGRWGQTLRGEHVAHYGLARSEGTLLRYLSDASRGLVHSVPEDLKSDELLDLAAWLGELVRQVDSSLIDEW